MNVNDLQTELVDAALEGASEYKFAAAGDVALSSPLYAWSLSELLKRLADMAVEFGKANRAELETAAQAAIDKLVAIDIPGIPDVVEAPLDAAAKQLAYEAVAKLLDAILGVQA